MKLFTQIVIAIALCGSVFSQTRKQIREAGVTQKEDVQLLRHAILQLEKKSYYAATVDLVQLSDHIKGNEYILFLLAKSYYLSRDYSNAIPVYEELIQKNSDTKYSIAYFQYAESLKYEGDYAKASMMYSKFKRTKSHNKEEKLAKQWSKNSRKYCQFAQDQILKDSAVIDVELMSSEINSSYTDFAPVQLEENKIMFASLRKDDVQYYKNKTAEDQKVNFYISDYEEEEGWSHPELVTELQDKFDHVANGTKGPDDYFYYTKCLTDYNFEVTCSIYRTKMENGVFSSKEEKLKSNINKSGYTSTQPTFGTCVKRIGKRKIKLPIMYFSSNRPGGVGGMDIWCTILEEGKFSHPINCGKRVNTVRDEVTPFYDSDSTQLYFSSNYHAGIGGFDVFSSKGSYNKFKTPHNIGMPVNSSYDDTYYSIVDGQGYLVSNRPGGFVLTSETCCDDIYSVEAKDLDSSTLEVLTTIILENVTLASIKNPGLNAYKRPVQDTKIALIRSYVVDELKVRNENVSNETILSYASYQGETNERGEIVFTHHLNSYYLLASKPGYKDTLMSLVDVNEIEIVMTKLVSEKPVIEPLVELESIEKNQSLVMEDIHFESNSALLTYDSQDALYVLQKYLELHPTAKIEVSGHTDNVGSHDNNMSLSLERAKAIQNFLSEHGIEYHRVKTIGHGEMKPIADNSTREGQKKNRRIEVKILHK